MIRGRNWRLEDKVNVKLEVVQLSLSSLRSRTSRGCSALLKVFSHVATLSRDTSIARNHLYAVDSMLGAVNVYFAL